jgi:hypothetical protein
MRFKHFLALKEELYPEEKQKVALWQRDPKAVQATDHFFGRGVDDHYHKLEGTQNKSEIHKKIEQHLGNEIHTDDYKSGYTKDKYDRKVRIGALLKKTKAPVELSRDFENDSTRQGKKFEFNGLTVKTTRSAEGVAGQTSHNQSWENESCKNYNTGSNRHYLKGEVKHGTVISYLHDHTGKEIARATLHPHINDEGHTAYAVDSHYGIDHAGFKDHVKKVAEQLSGQHKGGSLVYTKHPDVYNDSGDEEIMHPNADEKIINDRYEHLTGGHRSYDYEKSMLLQHPKLHQKHLDKIVDKMASNGDTSNFSDITKNPNLSSEHISKMLHSNMEIYHKSRLVTHRNVGMNDISKIIDSPDESHFGELKPHIVDNTKLTHEHISKLLNNKNPHIRGAITQHPNLSSEHISKALTDEDKSVRASAIRHPNVTSEHIDKALNDKDFHVRGSLFYNEHVNHLIKSEHINKGLEDSDKSYVARAAIDHPNATKEHIDKALNIEDPSVKIGAVLHKNATKEHIHKFLDDVSVASSEKAYMFRNSKGDIQPEHIDKALDHKSGNVREAALEHPNASPDNLIKGINHLEMGTQMTALQHKNVNDKVINHALGHSDDIVRMQILKHPNIKLHHIDWGMNDNNPGVRATAVKHPNATHEHILRGIHDPDHKVARSVKSNVNYHKHLEILDNMTDEETNVVLHKHGLPSVMNRS